MQHLQRYTLRGVATTKHTMYICRRTERDPESTAMEVDGEGSIDQWWRIQLKRWGPNPVTVEVSARCYLETAFTYQLQKTSEEKVLEAAKTETKVPLLVYASEKAMQFESKPLPIALEVCDVHT
jgi:hypothetical protein